VSTPLGLTVAWKVAEVSVAPPTETEPIETEVADAQADAVEENEDVSTPAEGSASDEAEASRVESEADDEGAV